MCNKFIQLNNKYPMQTKVSIKNILIPVIILTLVLITNPSFSPKAYSTGTWTQTSWVGGSGQTSWSDATKYNTTGGDGVFVSSNAGQITMRIYASHAIGQQDLTTVTANQGGSVGANTMSFATSVSRGGSMYVSADGKIFLADTSNHRVLIWNSIPTSNNVSADVVIGQASFTVVSANRGGSVADNTLNYPTGVYSDGTKLYITDTGNNRVLIYDTIPTSDGASANWVVGQPNMTSSTANNGGRGANTLNLKMGIGTPYWGSVYVTGGKLFISDSANHRVLIYDTVPTSNGVSANWVIGQLNMTSGTANQGGTAGAGTLSKPADVSSDGTKLFIVDNANNRVLIYNTIPTTQAEADAGANVVIGQPDMASSTGNNGGIGANTLVVPYSIYFNGTKLYISDYGNNRVLVYNSVPTENNASADETLGQANFTSDLSTLGSGPDVFVIPDSYAYVFLQPRGFFQNSSFRLILTQNRIKVHSLTTAHSSTLTSSIYDSGVPYTIWGPLSYTATLPTNTSVSFEVSTTGGASWQTVSNYTQQTFGPSQTVQYRATLSNTDGISTPILQDVSVAYQVFEGVTPGSGASSTSSGQASSSSSSSSSTPTPLASPEPTADAGTPSPAPTPSPSLTASPEATLTPSPAQSAQVSPVPSTTPASLFTKNLYFGLTDREVRILQQSLNNIGFKISTGWGSPGYETEFFGPKTYQSVLTFQKTYNIPQTGYFGPLSRAKMNELIK